jgi:hypothetical protein
VSRAGGRPALRPRLTQTLRHEQEDTGLVGIRDPAELAKLPAAERAAWRTFWSDVETLRSAK